MELTKNKIILVGIHGRPSMRLAYSTMKEGSLKVRRILRNVNGIKLYYRAYYNNNSVKVKKERSLDLSNSIVVRWGTRENIPVDSRSIVYNRADSIAKATDKKLSRIIMSREGVRCPKYITEHNVMLNDFPIIARPSIHAKGKNFIVLKDREEFLSHYQENEHNGWYYSAFVNKQSEYRIHMAHGKALAVMRKPRPKDKNQLAWNRSINEDPFEYVNWNECNSDSIKNAILESNKAIKALGLDFGGVDVITYGKNAYVLEVNTSPTLTSSEYVAERWGKYFDFLFSLDKRIHHWDLSRFKEGKSMIWKNSQLDIKNITDSVNRMSIRSSKKIKESIVDVLVNS